MTELEDNISRDRCLIIVYLLAELTDTRTILFTMSCRSNQPFPSGPTSQRDKSNKH